MRKKFIYLFSIFVFLFSATGCVRYQGNMEIKKDKSMSFSINYGLDSSIFGENAKISDEEKSNFEKQGFTVSDYSDGNYKGVTLTRKVKNIDSVSTDSDVKYSLSSDGSDSSKIFKVKKGFFKNTYVAKFDFDTSDSNLSNFDNSSDDLFNDDEIISSDDEVITNDDVITNDETEDNSDLNLFDDDDFSGMSSALSNMDLSFNVKLPYSSISNNASTSNNDGKDLSWNLVSGTNSIEFEFSLYNMSNIILVGGGALLLIILIIVIIVVSKKKKNRRDDASVDSSSVIPELSEVPNTTQPFSEQAFNQHLMSQNQGIDGMNLSSESNDLSGVQSNNLGVVNQPSEIDIVEPVDIVSDPVQTVSGIENISSVQSVQPQDIQSSQNIQNVQGMNSQDISNPQVMNTQGVSDQQVIDQSQQGMNTQNMNGSINMIPNDQFNNIFNQSSDSINNNQNNN